MRPFWFRPRVTIRKMMVATGIIAVWLGYLRTPPPEGYSSGYPYHRSQALDWANSAELCGDGVATIDPTPWGTELLSFNHYVARPRPTEPELARRFDQLCRENANKCRLMAAYHARMKRKWAWGYAFPWFGVEPDPPPPLRLEASGARDISF